MFGSPFRGLGSVSRKSRELFEPEKPVVNLRPAYSVKLVFSYVVKGITIKITAKFRASRHLRFEDTKRIMSPEIRPKSFGTFEKQAPVFQKSRKFSGLFRLFIYVFATPRFWASKLSNPLIFSHLKNTLKDQRFKPSGLQFDNWLFGPEKFSGLSRNRPRA